MIYKSLTTGGEDGGYYDEIILYNNGIVKRNFKLDLVKEDPKIIKY